MIDLDDEIVNLSSLDREDREDGEEGEAREDTIVVD